MELSPTAYAHPSRRIDWLTAVWLLTAVLLLCANLLPPAATIQWQTATEQNSAGFQLLRRAATEPGFTAVTDLIPAQGSPTTGATYRHTDRTLQRGHTYHYQLQEIELNGTAVAYPHFAQTITVPWLRPLPTLLSLLCFIIFIARARGQSKRAAQVQPSSSFL